MKRTGTTLALIGCLLLAATVAVAEPGTDRAEPNLGFKVLDAIIVRPVAMAGSFASSAVAVGLLPIAAPTGWSERVIEYLIIAPWRFTSGRYLGDFRNYEDGGGVM